jgi:GNAT superfamily N-acetyltransferase
MGEGRMGYTITDATEADAELIASIVRASFADVAARFGLTPENSPTHPSNCAPEWISAALAKGARYYVLQTPGGPAGCVALEQANEAKCYLERLAVLPAFRRHGFGEALVEHAIAKARGLGVQRVELGMVAAQAKLRRWYERLGFSVTTTVLFDGTLFEVAFMRRVLA